MVSAETTVTITMKALVISLLTIAGIVVAAGGILAGSFAYNLGHIRDDVKGVRDSVDGLRTADKDSLSRSRDVEIKLTEQIGGLRTDLATFSGKFDNLGSKLDSMVTSVNGLSTRMDKYQADLSSIQATWSDPKRIAEFAEALKKQGLGDQPIVIVPLR
jgi:hypothetical protein